MYYVHDPLHSGYKNCKSHILAAKNHFTHSSWIKQKDIKVELDLILEYQILPTKDSDLGKGKGWVLLDSRDQLFHWSIWILQFSKHELI